MSIKLKLEWAFYILLTMGEANSIRFFQAGTDYSPFGNTKALKKTAPPVSSWPVRVHRRRTILLFPPLKVGSVMCQSAIILFQNKDASSTAHCSLHSCLQYSETWLESVWKPLKSCLCARQPICRYKILDHSPVAISTSYTMWSIMLFTFLKSVSRVKRDLLCVDVARALTMSTFSKYSSLSCSGHATSASHVECLLVSPACVSPARACSAHGVSGQLSLSKRYPVNVLLGD